LGRPKTKLPPNTDPEWDLIRAKQDAVVAADPDVHFIHTEAATWDSIYYYDTFHYTQAGYDKIGTEGAIAAASILEPGASVGGF
jgi:hypothetical protein